MEGFGNDERAGQSARCVAAHSHGRCNCGRLVCRYCNTTVPIADGSTARTLLPVRIRGFWSTFRVSAVAAIVCRTHRWRVVSSPLGRGKAAVMLCMTTMARRARSAWISCTKCGYCVKVGGRYGKSERSSSGPSDQVIAGGGRRRRKFRRHRRYAVAPGHCARRGGSVSQMGDGGHRR